MRQGDTLAAWRADEGLSQEAAGRALARFLPHPSDGVTQGTWAAWESERKMPDLANAIAIEVLTKGKVAATGWVRARVKQRAHVRRRKGQPSGPPPSKRTGTDG
jgi:hypothetical protein